MVCNHCAAVSRINLKSIATFRHIMALAGPGSSIWLDNISIDQEDPHDVAAQISVMGDIYSRAECVFVLLPASDQEAYNIVAGIVDAAKTLVDDKWKFEYMSERKNYELRRPDGKWESALSDDNIGATGVLARKFFEDIRRLLENLQKYMLLL
jgi:Heterokaryon incompatibility protein (HET)